MADENYGKTDAKTMANSVSLAIVIYVLRERESFSSIKGKLLILCIQTPWENSKKTHIITFTLLLLTSVRRRYIPAFRISPFRPDGASWGQSELQCCSASQLCRHVSQCSFEIQKCSQREKSPKQLSHQAMFQGQASFYTKNASYAWISA